MSREGVKRRRKPEKNDTNASEGSLKCICKKKDERGMMIQCEACLVWQHTRCLGILENNLPPHYICYTCLHAKENLPTDFRFISGEKLRKEFEEDLIRIKKTPKKELEEGKYRRFLLLEKQLIEKYFGFYASSGDSKEKENIFCGVAMLLNCSLYGVGNLFKFLAEEIAEVNKDDDSDSDDDDDPYKDWNLIKKNIYSSKIEPITDGQLLDTDMQEPVKLSIKRFEEEWGVIIEESADRNQYLAEYLGIWLASKKACSEDTTPTCRFILAHPTQKICVDARRSGNTIRFVRRSCSPNSVLKEVMGPDNTRHLALFALEPLAANTEITIGFDRNWKTYSCNLKCACATPDCLVKQWYEERSAAATKLLDVFNKKNVLSKLRYSGSIVQQEDSDIDDSEDDSEDEENDEDDSEDGGDEDEEEHFPRRTLRGKSTKQPRRTPKKENPKSPQPPGSLSREERKLQLIMRSIEKMENRERMASLNGKKRKMDTKPDMSKNGKRKPVSEDVTKNTKRTRPSETQDWSRKERRSSLQEKQNGVASPITSEAKKTSPLVRIEKRRKSDVDCNPSSPQPPSGASATSPNPSSPSPPPAVGTTKFGKKAWLQEYEEKKQISKSTSELPTPTSTATAPSTTSTSSTPTTTSSGSYLFPLKKKMLDTFLSSNNTQQAENGQKTESAKQLQSGLRKSAEEASPSQSKPQTSPSGLPRSTEQIGTVKQENSSEFLTKASTQRSAVSLSADSIPAFKPLTQATENGSSRPRRDQPTLKAPTPPSSNQTPTTPPSPVATSTMPTNYEQEHRRRFGDCPPPSKSEDYVRSDYSSYTRSAAPYYNNEKRMHIPPVPSEVVGADAMDIDNEVNMQQNSILYVSPQPPRNVSSRQTPLPRSPSPPRTNHSPPQHSTVSSSSSSPHKSYAPPPPPPFHPSRPASLLQTPVAHNRPPYPNGRLQKPPPNYPSGPAYNNHHNWSTSGGRTNAGVIGAGGVVRSHDRYIRRDGYY